MLPKNTTVESQQSIDNCSRPTFTAREADDPNLLSCTVDNNSVEVVVNDEAENLEHEAAMSLLALFSKTDFVATEHHSVRITCLI